MKNGNEKPKPKVDRKQDELFFHSLPMFYHQQKQLKEELESIVRKKEGK
jgi:hypothetical protein